MPLSARRIQVIERPTVFGGQCQSSFVRAFSIGCFQDDRIFPGKTAGFGSRLWFIVPGCAHNKRCDPPAKWGMVCIRDFSFHDIFLVASIIPEREILGIKKRPGGRFFIAERPALICAWRSPGSRACQCRCRAGAGGRSSCPGPRSSPANGPPSPRCGRWRTSP